MHNFNPANLSTASSKFWFGQWNPNSRIFMTTESISADLGMFHDFVYVSFIFM